MEEKKLVDLHYSTNHHNFKTLCNEDKKNNTRKLLKFKISDPTILDSVYNVFCLKYRSVSKQKSLDSMFAVPHHGPHTKGPSYP